MNGWRNGQLNGRRIGRLLVPLLMALLLTACGSRAAQSADNYAAAAPAAEYDMAAGVTEYDYATDEIYVESAAEPQMDSAVVAEEMPADAGGALPPSEPQQSSAANPGALNARKLIRDADITVETEEFDHLLAVIEGKVEMLGGYLENLSTSQSSNYYVSNENRYASMTIRVPAERYSQFITEVADISNVLNRNESVRDVTAQYVDLESHRTVLRVEQERLTELLARAETVEDMIMLESRLSEVRYQLESMEIQLRTFDNLIAYSTIYLSINEVRQLTPVKEQTTWEKITTGFAGSWQALGNGLNNMLIGIIVASPFLLVWAVIIGGIFLLVRFLLRRLRRRPNSNNQNNKNIQNQNMQNQNIQNQNMQNQNIQNQNKVSDNLPPSAQVSADSLSADNRPAEKEE